MSCHACQRAAINDPHAKCFDHEKIATPPRDSFDLRRGPLGPVPRRAFAYVVGDVPRFDDETGRRIQ